MAKRTRKPVMPSMAKLEKLLGMKVDPDAWKNMTGQLQRDSKMGQTAKMEAVLDSLAFPEKARLSKVCKNKRCEEPFMTTYRYVAYCSDACRRESLAEDYGIETVEKNYIGMPDELRWGGTEYPGIVDPKALSVMKYLIEKVESETGHPVQPWRDPQQPNEPQSQSASSQKSSESSSDFDLDLSGIDELLQDNF